METKKYSATPLATWKVLAQTLDVVALFVVVRGSLRCGDLEPSIGRVFGLL
jgi:hypothetical protein